MEAGAAVVRPRVERRRVVRVRYCMLVVVAVFEVVGWCWLWCRKVD